MKVYRDVVENGELVSKEIFDIIECTYSGKFMGERSITATIQWASPIDFQIGDYIDMEMQSLVKGVNNEGVIGYEEGDLHNIPERFYIYTMPTIKKTARSGTHGQGFEHHVIFYPAQHELACVQMRDMGNSMSADSIIYTGFDTVTFYGGAFELMERIMEVLKVSYHDAEGNPLWQYEIADSVNEQKNTALERFPFNFSGNTVMDALLKLSDKEGINTTFFINNRTIYVGFKRPYFCRVADGGVIDTDLSTQMFSFQYGKTSHLDKTISHGGLYDITKTIGKELPITKLFAYGASRNLNRHYCSDRVAGGRYVNRLMLPSFDMDGKTDYIISEDSMAKYGMREASKQFEDIYPSLRYMTYGDLRTIRYCIKIKASGLNDDSITNPAYNVARVQCYKVVDGSNGVNHLEEAAPPDDLAIFVHAEGKIVKVVLYGGSTDEEAIAKQLQHDAKVPTRTANGDDYIPGSCFLVHDSGFGNAGSLDRDMWFNDAESGSFEDSQKEEIKLHQINYTDTFWLTDLYVFQSYNQTYFSRDGYSAWAWARLNSKYTTKNSFVAVDSTPVNTILGVEPVTIVDTSMTAADLDKQQKTFDIYLGDTGFKIDEQNDFGEMVFVVAGTVKVSILDGLLAGREFEVNGAVTDSQFSCICAYNDDGTRNEEFFKASDYSGEDIPQRAFDNGAIWRLRLNRINLDEPDYSNMNIAIPNTQINASVGDHLVLLDIFMPDIYIHAAENRLLREARKYLDANDNGTVNYAVTFDKVRMHQVPLYSMQMREGLNIRMVDDDLNIQTENNGRYISDYRDNPLISSRPVEHAKQSWEYSSDYISAEATIVEDKLLVDVVLQYEEQWLNNNPIRIVQNNTNYDLGRPKKSESKGWSDSLGGHLYRIYYSVPTGINFDEDHTIYRNKLQNNISNLVWLSMVDAVDFTKGKYYTARLRVKDNGYFRSGSLFVVKNDDNIMFTPDIYNIQEERKEGEPYLYITCWFYLGENFNDDVVYYPSVLFETDGRDSDVSVQLISIYEQDYADDDMVLPYADFTIDSITIKIYDSSNRTNAQPVKEISATLSEQHNATAWASLMNRVESTEKESESNKLTYQEIINTARRHYQTLLNLRNSIFDPDGTCDQTFLQVMMMQVGADSMNYQLHRTRVGLSSNGDVQFFNCSCERHDDGLYHFVVNNADTLDHFVFTDGDHKGTWNIPSGIDKALIKEDEDSDTFPPYFISIKCPKNEGDATWECGTTQRKLNEDQSAWYFNWGILTPDSEGNYTLTETRGNAYMYGDNLICGKISDLAQKSYFDLTNGDFVLGQKSDGKAALSYINDVLTIGGFDPDKPDGSLDEILRRLDIVEGVASGAQTTANEANATAGAAQGIANDAATNAGEALTAAQEAEANAKSLEYLKNALQNDTDIAGGLIATSQIQLRDKTGKYIDEEGNVYAEAGEGRTEQYKVNSGMSGISDDNILIWGGGTYAEAVAAEKHNFVKDQNGNLITTLLKRNGTGKIGICRITDSELTVNIKGKGSVIIDASENNGGIRFFNSDGMLVSGMVLSSIAGYSNAPLEDITTLDEDIINYNKIDGQYISVGENSYTLKPQSDDVPQEGVVVEHENNYVKTTTTSITKKSVTVAPILIKGNIEVQVEYGSNQPTIEFTIDLYNDNGELLKHDEARPDFVNQGGSNYIYKADFEEQTLFVNSVIDGYDGNVNVIVTLNLQGDIVNITSCDLSLSQDEDNFCKYKTTTTISYSYHSYTLVGEDGFVSVKDNKRYFVIDNSEIEQKILTSGLPTSDSDDLENGQLYVLNGVLHVKQK